MKSKYGVDVAMVRADDLDKKMIRWVESCVARDGSPLILDLGCGSGGQSARLVAAGASVVGVDVVDHSEFFSSSRASQGFSEDVLKFAMGDMSQLDDVLGEQQFDGVCLQRTLHYVPYAVALRILIELRKRVRLGGKLYIAVTGIESDIGHEYQDASAVAEDRFCRLNTVNAETFSITEPVCLYTPEEFVVLLQDSGWNIEECWVSAFGNIKAICS